MKNVLTYISACEPPAFDAESERMVRVQIDNSLELGWKLEDIVIAADFPFSYNGYKGVVIPREGMGFVHTRRSRGVNKVVTILWLYEQGYLNDSVFFHDLDAFQNYPFFECPDPQYHSFDLTVAQYGDSKTYNAGCMFFKAAARDIWQDLLRLCRQNGWDEERALTVGYPPGKDPRVGMLDISYNVGKYDTVKKWRGGIQPPRILHFHPNIRGNYAFYVQGRNEANQPLVCERVGRLITKHFRS